MVVTTLISAFKDELKLKSVTEKNIAMIYFPSLLELIIGYLILNVYYNEFVMLYYYVLCNVIT